jgi:AbrB family looped-hinge helix DNA binding protein
MVAKVSVKGQTVIPEAIREQARIRKGDELDVGYANGLIVMRKRQPLNAGLIRALLFFMPQLARHGETEFTPPLRHPFQAGNGCPPPSARQRHFVFSPFGQT